MRPPSWTCVYVMTVLTWLCTVAPIAGSSGVQTLLHVKPGAVANERVELDLEIIDSFGYSIPWSDLYVHHGRKIHVYVVHEELAYIQHVHPDDFKQLTEDATTFPIWITFPLDGAWIMHTSFVIRSNHNPLGDTISDVHMVNVTVGHTDPQGLGNAVTHKSLEMSGIPCPMAKTEIKSMHTEDGMVRFPANKNHAEVQVVLELPSGGLWKGHCHRLVLRFEGAHSNDVDVELTPFLGAAMHAFVAQHPQDMLMGNDLIHAHGFPRSMDSVMRSKAEETGTDLCSMDVHSMDHSKAQGSLELEVVTYIRFRESGPYALFIQVATGDQVHMARIDVYVQDLTADAQPIKEHSSGQSGVKLSFTSLFSEAEPHQLSPDQVMAMVRDAPCVTATNMALTWFGSMCLSACVPDDAESALVCDIPFPADGEYRLYTLGDVASPVDGSTQSIPMYLKNQITLGRLPPPEMMQTGHAVRKVEAGDSVRHAHFTGADLRAITAKAEDVDVQLTANGGMTVYAGSCAFLELMYRRRLDNGTMVELIELQPLMRSAARVLVVGPEYKEADLVVAHSLKDTLFRPWDFLDSSIEGQDGMLLWSKNNPCVPGLQRVPVPRVTGDQGPRVGQYFRFTKAGTYTVLAQAQYRDHSIISRHNITVCDWKASGSWSDRCLWNVPPTAHAHVTIEEEMTVFLDVAPPPLASLTVAGTLRIQPELDNVKLSAGSIQIKKNGVLQLGTRDELFDGHFELNLNSSLHELAPNAVSYLDVHGSLQLKSTDIETPAESIPSWTAIKFTADSFVLEETKEVRSAGFLANGARLGVVSSHGEEVVYVYKYRKGGQVVLTSPLQVNHGSKAVVYNLSHRIRITGSGPVAIRVWNGQPDAGGVVGRVKETFHHHRRVASAANSATALLHPHRAVGEARPVLYNKATTRRLFRISSAEEGACLADAGFHDTNVYRSSLEGQQRAGLLELHGVEISGFGVPGLSTVHAAIDMIDFACAVRWPEFRKYISLISTSMHSLSTGCIHFQGCAGGLEIQNSICFGSNGDGIALMPIDVLQSPPWRVGVEDSIVHISSAAGLVSIGSNNQRPPVAFFVGNAAMPTGSLTHGLALSVSDNFFINQAGPAVVWSPAVPGRLENCNTRGDAVATAAFFSSCTRDADGHGFIVSEINKTDLSAFQPSVDTPPGLLQRIVGLSMDDELVRVKGASGLHGEVPMAQLHVHVPPEAYGMAIILDTLEGAEELWATLTWPTQSSLWSESKQQKQAFTGGIPCVPGVSGCPSANQYSNRAAKAWLFNELVDGPLQPAAGQPVEFVLATKGEGVYGVGFLPTQPQQVSTSAAEHGDFAAAIAGDMQRCSPEHVPAAVEASKSTPDSMSWQSLGRNWYTQCLRPTQVSLNQPTRGFVLTGSTFEYFHFRIPKGVKALFVVVKSIYSDENDAMIDFYATRNSLWTKKTPYATDQGTLQAFPALQKDTDTSSRLSYDISALARFPAWGDYYGIISQGPRSSLSKMEVEITVIASEDTASYKLLKSGVAKMDSALRAAQRRNADVVIQAGQTSLQMGPSGESETSSQMFIVHVPSGVQEVMLSIEPAAGVTLSASHSSWIEHTSNAQYELESTSGSLLLSTAELYGRWGTWFMSLSIDRDSLPASGKIQVQLDMTNGTCGGTPACSGNGVCMQDSGGSVWCRCQPGWYGHMCEVQAASVHGGIFKDLPDQLLLSMDSILEDASVRDIIHLELRAPLIAAAASREEMAEASTELFSERMCSFVSSEGSDDMPTNRKQRSPDDESTKKEAPSKTKSQGHSADADSPKAVPNRTPSAAMGDKTAEANQGRDQSNRDPGRAKKPDTRRRSTSTKGKSQEPLPPQGTVRGPRPSTIDLLLPGAVLEVPYAAAITEYLQTSTAASGVDIKQGPALVTAYSVRVRGRVSRSNEPVISALNDALSVQVQHPTGEHPRVQVVSTASGGAFSSAYKQNVSSDSTERRLLAGESVSVNTSFVVGVLIDRISPQQLAVLESRLEEASTVDQVRKFANNQLHASGFSISKLIPGMVVPSVLVAVDCMGSERLCGQNATEWDRAVHAAAKAQKLQEPDDVWVFERSGSDSLKPLSEDFASVELKQEQSLSWRLLGLAGVGTLFVVFVAIAVYGMYSRVQGRRPRHTLWEGYSAVGGRAGAVGEATSPGPSPLSMRELSPMAHSAAQPRATRNSSVIEFCRQMTNYPWCTSIEQPWVGDNARTSSLTAAMGTGLVCHGLDEDLATAPTISSLPSGSIVDIQAQFRGVASWNPSSGKPMVGPACAGGLLRSSTLTSDGEAPSRPLRRMSLLRLTGRRATQVTAPEVPNLHVSCSPPTDHLLAHKAWMKGSRTSNRRADWLSAGRRSLMLRTTTAMSLNEAVDISLSNLGSKQLEPSPSSGATTLSPNKLAVIDEATGGHGPSDSDEMHSPPSIRSGSFPRASRRSSIALLDTLCSMDNEEDVGWGLDPSAAPPHPPSSQRDLEEATEDQVSPSADEASPPHGAEEQFAASPEAKLREELGIVRAVGPGMQYLAHMGNCLGNDDTISEELSRKTARQGGERKYQQGESVLASVTPDAVQLPVFISMEATD